MGDWPAAPAPWGATPPAWSSVEPSGGWAQPPPKRKMRLTWLWVLLGIVGVLGVTGITLVVMFVHAVEPPVDAMNRYLAAVNRHDYDAAYSMLCRDEQASTPRDQFGVAVGPFVSNLHVYDVYSFDPLGNERTVRYRVVNSSGHDETYQATMVHENGAWRVCDFFK